MTTSVIKYTSTFLKLICKLSDIKEDFAAFYLEHQKRVYMTTLGIRKHVQTYRRSRGGQRLFHRIHVKVSNFQCITRRSSQSELSRGVNNNNTPVETLSTQTKGPKPKCDKLHSAHVNCRSVVNKTQAIQPELFTNNLDICALTEIWIKSDDNLTCICICPLGYNSMSEPRQDKMGGGLAIVYKEAINITKHEAPKYQTMELAGFKIKPWTSLPATTLTIIYIPPDSNVLSFLHECSDHLERTIIENGKAILLRDFNIHINRADNMDVINFFGLP